MKKIVSKHCLIRNLKLIVMLVFWGCNSPEISKYKELKSYPKKKTVFEILHMEDDSISLDTQNVAILNKKILFTYVNEANKPEKMELFHLYEFDLENDSMMRTTFINYDICRDSIRGFYTSESYFGEIKTYQIKHKNYQILKQPQWFFTKSTQPNLMTFYSMEFGQIASLSTIQGKRSSKLKFIIDEAENKDFNEVLDSLILDKKFFNMVLKHK